MPKVIEKKTGSKTVAKPAPAVKKPKPVESRREILYHKPACKLFDEAEPLSMQIAMDLLGWEEEGETKFGQDFLFRDVYGKKIRCHNNDANRPLYFNTNVLTLKQEILNRRWRLNGETIIIGNTARILNGQHQLIALVLACQEWHKDQDKWSRWEHEPVIFKFVVYGIDEDSVTADTMDTCKPRSLPDVLYRSAHFEKFKANQRKTAAGICDFGIRCLWHRTGAQNNAYAPRRTHAESLDFINRHPTLLKCVKHIFEEDAGKNKVGQFIKPGMAAGLLYLMASGRTDRTAYYESDNPNEEYLNWDLYDKAFDFWVLLAAGSEDFVAFRAKYVELAAAGILTTSVRCALIGKAWAVFAEGEAITLADLDLNFQEDEAGYLQLAELPTMGGIDIGRPDESKDPEPKEEPKPKTKPVKPVKGKKPRAETGNTVYVSEDGGYWQGELVSTRDVPNGKIAVVRDVRGKEFEVLMDNVSLSEPL